jgi:hypothetical protein
MKVLFTSTKGKLMDTVEKFHVYKETRKNNQINDKNTVKPNAIFDKINSQKNKTSHGYDGISDNILKASAPFIISPLTYIFNKVLSTGVFPDRLKYSEVQPLF